MSLGWRWARLMAVGVLCGCSRFHPHLAANYVYVTAKETFLRDRIAAVSNRTGTVHNGDRLKVLDHGRRFIKVETEKGEQGWIDEKVVAPQEIFDGFGELGRAHGIDKPIVSAVVRDEVYMHLKPGRDTEKLFRLGEGEKLQLLTRATLPKAVAGAPLKARAAATAVPVAGDPPVRKGAKSAAPAIAEAPAAPAMEDWWLVRDSHGRTGWLLSRMMDVDAPESLVRYAEGQRIVGAYVLNKINDPDAPFDDKNVPEYVAVMSPYKAGLPYDFDQVRLFIWNAKKHRYETGFREKNVEGYLPVEITAMKDPNEKGTIGAVELPAFRYKVLAADAAAVLPDAATGQVKPGRTIVKTYRLEGNITHRVLGAEEMPEEEAHPVPPDELKKKLRR